MKKGVVILSIVINAACSESPNLSGNSSTKQSVTYWGDVLPIMEKHCLSCHQKNGIGPFQLDNYATAKAHAAEIRDATASRAMPPWAVSADGSCGNFSDSLALSTEQIAKIAAWVEGGSIEGAPRAVQLPERPGLEDATEFLTPRFAPKVQGGTLAEFDEYRCFALNSGITEQQFITAYEVQPGTPEIVHHVIAYVVDPEAPANVAGKTNAQVIQALDDESPNRDGWPCFGAAGEGVNILSAPAVWAPGQGALTFPNQSGVPLRPKDKLIIQIHYNLADDVRTTKTDQTKLKLRMQPEVANVGLFFIGDPLLGSLSSDTPITLEPGKNSVKYTWRNTLAELGLNTPSQVEFHGVFPHMHELGHKYQLRIDQGQGNQCAANVEDWDFHWQRMYFFSKPYILTQQSSVEITCDYDTSTKTEPVWPGWGTRNEMCTGIFFFTAPISAIGGRTH